MYICMYFYIYIIIHFLYTFIFHIDVECACLFGSEFLHVLSEHALKTIFFCIHTDSIPSSAIFYIFLTKFKDALGDPFFV